MENGKAKHQSKRESDWTSLTEGNEIRNLLDMQRTCQPFLLVLIACFSLLLWGGLQGCSGDTGKTGEEGNQTSSETTDNYPLKVCVVSGKELGSMGESYLHEHNGTTVKFCCEPCLEKFNEDPGKYLAKLKQ